MYRKAAHITVISPSMLENLVRKGVDREKISIIPNFVDTDFIRPLPRDNEFARQFGLADKFVVTHAGNIGYVYDLETLLEAASLVHVEQKIMFLIVGNGVARTELERKTRELKLDNVRFIPFQPHETLPWLRATSDVQLSLYKNGAANDSFPSKIYEIMASGRPLLASAEPESGVANLVRDASCGIYVTPGKPTELADAILKLYNEPLTRAAMGERGRKYAEEHFSKQVAVASYHELLQRVHSERVLKDSPQRRGVRRGREILGESLRDIAGDYRKGKA